MFGIDGHSTETLVELLSEVTLLISWVLSKWSLLSTMRMNFMARALGPATLESCFQIIHYQIIGISSISRLS
jgi:hypothetical protein